MKYLYLLLLFSFSIPASAQLKGIVIGITDGDSFTLLTEDKNQHKIRVYGIDCPERGQDYGHIAKKFTSDLIYRKEVYVKQIDIDRYGRIVGIAYVLPDRINLNEELLKAGLAWHYTYFDKNEAWTKFEQEARKKKIGLWKMSNATAPWVYRKK